MAIHKGSRSRSRKHSSCKRRHSSSRSVSTTLSWSRPSLAHCTHKEQMIFDFSEWIRYSRGGYGSHEGDDPGVDSGAG